MGCDLSRDGWGSLSSYALGLIPYILLCYDINSINMKNSVFEYPEIFRGGVWNFLLKTPSKLKKIPKGEGPPKPPMTVIYFKDGLTASYFEYTAQNMSVFENTGNFILVKFLKKLILVVRIVLLLGRELEVVKSTQLHF